MNIKVPTRAPGPAYWLLTDAHIDHWMELYPELNVISEVRLAIDWLETHPERRKTVRGMPRFFSGWLNRARTTWNICIPIKYRSADSAPRGGWLGMRSVRWKCPHVEPCNNRITCDLRDAQNRPRKAATAATR